MHTVPSVVDCVKLDSVPEPGSAVSVWTEIDDLDVCEGVGVYDPKVGNKTMKETLGYITVGSVVSDERQEKVDYFDVKRHPTTGRKVGGGVFDAVTFLSPGVPSEHHNTSGVTIFVKNTTNGLAAYERKIHVGSTVGTGQS